MKGKTASAPFESIKMNNNSQIPCLGLGTYQIPSKDIYASLHAGYLSGYRLIDTARMYGNEAAIGLALQKLEKTYGVGRKDFFITTKILPAETNYKGVFESIEKSLAALSTDYIDLLLIHWPTQGVAGRIGAWKAMEKLYEQGVARNIGVSNFTKLHLESLLKRDITITPCVNQIEIHPQYADWETSYYKSIKGKQQELSSNLQY
eukprot:TRINITY_DN1113_c0_g1_i2.p2 TRINITY_DN1113_c0_g1~~TRINITY_DN1113_c0_g1_i2.p2  ORF type:complete len:205 (-),score=12.53 TRINITY_DN1113_c0_g1_i2:426-1040(-)